MPKIKKIGSQPSSNQDPSSGSWILDPEIPTLFGLWIDKVFVFEGFPNALQILRKHLNEKAKYVM